MILGRALITRYTQAHPYRNSRLRYVDIRNERARLCRSQRAQVIKQGRPGSTGPVVCSFNAGDEVRHWPDPAIAGASCRKINSDTRLYHNAGRMSGPQL